MSVRTRLVGGVVAVSTMVGLGVVAGPASAADPVRPSVLSLSATPSAVTAPGNTTVQIRVASPERPAQVTVTYVEPSGGGRVVQPGMVDAAAGEYTGTATFPIKDGVENGHWKVAYVQVITPSLVTNICDTTWQKDYCTGSQDFSSAGIDVSGSTWDVAAPIINSVTPPSTPVRPGESYTVAWDAADTHPLAYLSMRFLNAAPQARSNQITVSTTSSTALAAGQLSAVLPASAYDGNYVLTSLTVRDTVGNTAAYLPDGSVVLTNGAKQPKTHGLTFAAISIPVTGSTQDVTPPVLTSLTPSRKNVVSQNGVRFAYTSTDQSVPYTKVQLELVTPSGFVLVESPDAPLSASGTIDLLLYEVGVHQVRKLVLTDARSNTIEYRRDGTTYNPLTKVTGHHTLDLAAADITVTPLLLEAVATPHAHAAVVSWIHPEGEGPNVTGYRVVASPGGAVVDVAAGAAGTKNATFTGLQNSVTYTFTVTAKSTLGSGPSVTTTAFPVFSTNVWGAGDVNGDRRNDLFAALPLTNEPGTIFRVYRGTNGPGFGKGTLVLSSPSSARGFARSSLWDSAAFLRVSDTADLNIERVGVNGQIDFTMGLTRGWAMRFIDGHADFTGDGIADIVGVRHDGTAYLYRGTMKNDWPGYTSGVRIATGWNTMQTVFAATDVTGDKRADLLGVDKAGVLWIFPGTGKGTFSPKRKVSSGWGGLGALFSARDVSGDGKVDLGAITMDGTLRVYKGRANGTFSSAISVSKGWAPYL